ncbi:MAG: Kazal-type serine protease inhibitor family protein [Flavobacteriaceae bacterium]|nr:Kazal-type serine protease inhibitor family protein [Flavobacteriaceae bacterium]
MRLFLVASIILLSSKCGPDEPYYGCVLDPQSEITCTTEYDPVCGCNNVTYANSCSAEAAGMWNYVGGACENGN